MPMQAGKEEMRGRKRLWLAAAWTAMVVQVLVCVTPIGALAASAAAQGNTSEAVTTQDYENEQTQRSSESIDSNTDSSWPQGPSIGAEGAVLMDADTGEILYSKNQNEQLYPASITKIMTALLAYENLKLDDKVTFSQNAVFGIDRDSSNIGMDVGESITVRQALYGMMVESANEVAVALAETVSGSTEKFAALMNKRAKELGCTGSNFVTPNGLHDSAHVTTAHDMALIAREYFSHPFLCKVSNTATYTFHKTKTQPDTFTITTLNKFVNGSIECEGLVGSKTGYTNVARETLVTCAERGGVRLIAVVLREEPPAQFDDTLSLFKYGFSNFSRVHVAEEESGYQVSSGSFLSGGEELFGSSSPLFVIDPDAELLIPKGARFSDLKSTLTKGESTNLKPGDVMGTITYTYSKTRVGTADLLFAGEESVSSSSTAATSAAAAGKEEKSGGSDAAYTAPRGPVAGFFYSLFHRSANGSYYLNLVLLLGILLLVSAVLALVFGLHAYADFVEQQRRRARRRAREAARQSERRGNAPGSGSSRRAGTGVRSQSRGSRRESTGGRRPRR